MAPPTECDSELLLVDGNTLRKWVWRAGIVLATADGCGTNENMRRAATSNPSVWCWQKLPRVHGDREVRGDTRFAYNAAGVPVAAGVLYLLTGLLLSPMIAAAAMSLSSVSVITNALRLRRIDL